MKSVIQFTQLIRIGPVPWLYIAEKFEAKYVATASILCIYRKISWLRGH